jgi:hypothetical protein
VPYNVILISSFEFLNDTVFVDNDSIIFSKDALGIVSEWLGGKQ